MDLLLIVPNETAAMGMVATSQKECNVTGATVVTYCRVVCREPNVDHFQAIAWTALF